MTSATENLDKVRKDALAEEQKVVAALKGTPEDVAKGTKAAEVDRLKKIGVAQNSLRIAERNQTIFHEETALGKLSEAVKLGEEKITKTLTDAQAALTKATTDKASKDVIDRAQKAVDAAQERVALLPAVKDIENLKAIGLPKLEEELDKAYKAHVAHPRDARLKTAFHDAVDTRNILRDVLRMTS